jgi:hypothetical protein
MSRSPLLVPPYYRDKEDVWPSSAATISVRRSRDGRLALFKEGQHWSRLYSDADVMTREVPLAENDVDRDCERAR